MENTLIVISWFALAILVYLMWRSATSKEWQEVSKQYHSKAKKAVALEILQKMRNAYDRIPSIPFLDKQTSVVIYLSSLVFFIFLFYVFFTLPPPQVVFVQDPILPNTALRLQAGEKYVYEISDGVQKNTFTYQVLKHYSCPGVVVQELTQQQTSSLCILSNGSFSDSEGISGEGGILLFSPWMLAVSENFSWESTFLISSLNIKIEVPIKYSFVMTNSTAGRPSFIIKSKIDDDPPIFYHIDAEKRVPLFISSQNVTIRLVGAPFELNWN
ncbi:MAG: hypothetical protein QXN37_03265 [Candidatus Anstonellaceae archaeon]